MDCRTTDTKGMTEYRVIGTLITYERFRSYTIDPIDPEAVSVDIVVTTANGQSGARRAAALKVCRIAGTSMVSRQRILDSRFYWDGHPDIREIHAESSVSLDQQIDQHARLPGF